MSRAPQPVGEVLRATLAVPAEHAALAAVTRVWPGAVGELVAREAWPARLSERDGLLVHCSSGVWASELQHLEGSLRESLERAGVRPAPALRFRVGAVPRRAGEQVPDTAARPLSAHERERVAEWLAPLRDPRLRELAEVALTRVAARRAAAGAAHGLGASDRPAC